MSNVKFLCFVVLLTIPLLLIPAAAAYANHQNIEKPCNVNISGKIVPIKYDGQHRNNPDGTLYPGDGAHFIFKFRGSETCVGFLAQPIKSEGAIDMLSHYITMGPSKEIDEKTHPHHNYQYVAKYLKTYHYYEVLGYEISKCYIGAGSNCKPISTPILAEEPVLSIREDMVPTKKQQKIIRPPADCYFCKQVIREFTASWHLAQEKTTQNTRIDEHVLEDEESIVSFEKAVKDTCSDLPKHHGCVYGHMEIDTEIINQKCLLEELEKSDINHDIEEDTCVDITDEISLTVEGQEIVCDDEDCKTVAVSRTKDLASHVVDPVFELLLEKPALKDSDYYDAMNLDGTYYLHDPVTITHDPTLQWKEKRDKTIQFETAKTMPLGLEDNLDCKVNDCDYIVPLNGLHPTSHEFVNGQGISIFNATYEDEFGLHSFDYESTVFNIDRKIGTVTASTGAEIVSYDPQLECHPYPLLADGFELAYDDRQAAACHYMGNLRDDTIHTEERSKHNYSFSSGVAYDPHLPEQIYQNFTFSEAFNESSEHLALESYNKTTMFIQEGYGKLYFDYPLGDVVFDGAIPKYGNVTSFTTLHSTDFAAKDVILDNYSMRYPENPFSKNVIIKNVNHNGTVIDADITLEVKPYEKIGTEYLEEYVFDKIEFDTSDVIFARIISDDLYSMQQKYNGNGMLDVTIFKTPIFFDEHVKQSDIGNKNFSGRLVDLPELAENPDTLRLTLPYDIGLGSISPTTLVITVNNVTNSFDERYFAYGGVMDITINTQKDNPLKIDRDVGKIIVYPSAYFGQITAVYVDEKPVRQECKFGCVLLFQPERDLRISVENAWGGTATADAPKPLRGETPVSEIFGYRMIIGIVAGLVAVYFLITKFVMKE